MIQIKRLKPKYRCFKRDMVKKALQVMLLCVICNSAASAKTLLVLGDSLSAGYGIRVEQGWVQRLQAKLGDSYQVVNASVSGHTSAEGLARLPTLLENYRPDIVMIELGGNDGLRGYPVRTLKTNLERLIESSLQAGASVLTLGMRIPPNYGARYARQFEGVFESLADIPGVVVVPFLLDGIALHPEMMQQDGIHPTEAAQQKMLENVWPYLQPLLSR